MRAIQIREYGTKFYLTETRIPDIGVNEVLVEVKASGLCLTDIHLLEGVQSVDPLPRVPGHENSGIISKVGSQVKGWRVGQRVVLGIDANCGRCEFCQRGQTELCIANQRVGFERDGGHADYVAVPAANLIELPDSISFDDACIIPDAIGCMYHSLVNLAGMRCGQKVAILGAGGLGLHGIQLVKLMGADVITTSRRTSRLEMAASMGAEVVDTGKEHIFDRVTKFTTGHGLDIVADCIGTKQSIREGLAMLKPGGTFLLLAYIDKELTFDSIPFFSKEKRILGCRGCTRLEIKQVIDLMAEGKLSSIIGARYPIEQFNEAAEELRQGHVVGRTVITR